MAVLDHPADQPRRALGRADPLVVDHVGAGGEQLAVVAAVDHLVGVGQDDPVKGHAQVVEQPQLGHRAGAALAVGQHRRPDPGHGDGRRLEDPAVAVAGPAGAAGHLDHAGAVGRAPQHRPVEVVGVDAVLDLAGEQLRHLRRLQQLAPVALAVVAGVVQAGGGDDVDPGAAADRGQLGHVAAGVGRHGVDHGGHAGGHARAELVDSVVDALQGDLRVDDLGHAAVDDQVLVGVADPELAAGDVAEHGPDVVLGTAHGAAVARSGVSTAPASRSAERSRPKGRSRRSARRVAASAAAVPAAWPMAMHWAIERTEAWASWVAEKQRPATSTLLASRATSVPSGMPTTWPSGRYRQVVPGRCGGPRWGRRTGRSGRRTGGPRARRRR